MVVITDEQIVQRIVEVLQRADLTTITFAAIRRQLEEDFRIDLAEKKAFIREQVDLYLQLQHHKNYQHQQHHYQQLQQLQLQQQQQQHQQHHQQLQHFRDAQQLQPFLRRRDEGLFLAPHASQEEIDDTVQIIVEEEYEDHQPDATNFQGNSSNSSKKKGPEKKKRTGGGLVKPCGLSEELQAILGERELSRIQVVKSLWVYIREKNLQDPENRRKIICDDALRGLLGCESTDMFQMNKLLSKHIWPLVDAQRDGEEPKPKRVKPDKRAHRDIGGSGKLNRFMAPNQLSEALINFLGTGESELPRTEVVKRMWDYIKGNQLQDPADKRRIVCDSKLQELFGCDTFNGFGMARYLSPHFIKS